PVGLVRGHVGGLDRAAVFLGVRFELLGERSLVERLAARARDLLEHVRMRWPAETLPGLWRVTVRQERVSEPGLAFQYRHLLGPLARDRRRDEEPFASVADRALEEPLER